jgi:hypothetical protein
MTVALASVLCLGGWIGFRYVETASSACDCEDPVDRDRFAIWNPVRDRSPERLAIEVVGAEQSGHCVTLTTGAPFCPESMQSTVSAWKITGRRLNEEQATIRFWVTRPGHAFGDPLWVRMHKQGGSWNVDGVDTYY